MKIFKNLQVSIDFSTKFPYKCIFLNFLHFCPNFREKFAKIFKLFENMANFLLKLSKIEIFCLNFVNCCLNIVNFSLLFKIFLKTSSASERLHTQNPMLQPHYKLSPDGPRPPEKIPARANVERWHYE